jgi:NAD(P)-dependent dehydrogenase (short-subunit alcohol dehydrogenase family)
MQTQQRYVGRVAVVTGAASGIGRAVAFQLAVEGATVVAVDVDAEELATTKKLIESVDREAITVVADVTDQADIARVIGALEDQRVDLLANVAGIMDHFLPVSEVDDATWDRVLAVNLTGPMRLSRAVIPFMQADHHGVIVNVSSIGGLTGAVAGSAYTASKHGLIGLTRSIAALYAEDGIRAVAVCPGGVETNIGRTAFPQSPWAYRRLEKSFNNSIRMAVPKEIATLVCWLGSDEAVNVNGAVVTSDGGWMS